MTNQKYIFDLHFSNIFGALYARHSYVHALEKSFVINVQMLNQKAIERHTAIQNQSIFTFLHVLLNLGINMASLIFLMN